MLSLICHHALWYTRRYWHLLSFSEEAEVFLHDSLWKSQVLLMQPPLESNQIFDKHCVLVGAKSYSSRFLHLVGRLCFKIDGGVTTLAAQLCV